MKKLIYIVTLLISSQLGAQDLYDQVWVFDKYIIFDFSTEPPTITLENPTPWLGPGNYTTSICNKYGELQFYSGGCFVGNRLHEVMENGDSINSAFAYTGWCNVGDIPIHQSNTILPYPNDSTKYLLFNLDMDTPPPSPPTSFVPHHLYYHIIDMTQDSGLGAVVEKKKIAMEDYLARAGLTAVRHVNGQDWWVVMPGFNSNCYYVLPVTSNGIGTPVQQCLGVTFGVDEGGGQASFSPNGAKYARVDPNYSLLLMDFDALTGQFNNPKELSYPSDYLYAHGLCFSGNSRYLYVNAINKIYQFDTEAVDIQASRQLVGEIDPDTLSQGMGALQLAKLAPNSKIYIVTPGLHRYISTIERPNCPGTLCNFRAHNILLPANNYGGINNLPHFRVPEQTYDCKAVSTAEIADAREVKISPNPASDLIILTTVSACTLIIYTPEGKLLQQKTLLPGETQVQVHLLPGLYFFQCQMENGNTITHRIIVQR